MKHLSNHNDQIEHNKIKFKAEMLERTGSNADSKSIMRGTSTARKVGPISGQMIRLEDDLLHKHQLLYKYTNTYTYKCIYIYRYV